MEYPDEVILGIIEYLFNDENEDGEVSKLLDLGYELDLIESLMYAGLITINKADCEDPHGEYHVTNMGKEYFELIL